MFSNEYRSGVSHTYLNKYDEMIILYKCQRYWNFISNFCGICWYADHA